MNRNAESRDISQPAHQHFHYTQKHRNRIQLNNRWFSQLVRSLIPKRADEMSSSPKFFLTLNQISISASEFLGRDLSLTISRH